MGVTRHTHTHTSQSFIETMDVGGWRHSGLRKTTDVVLDVGERAAHLLRGREGVDCHFLGSVFCQIES